MPRSRGRKHKITFPLSPPPKPTPDAYGFWKALWQAIKKWGLPVALGSFLLTEITSNPVISDQGPDTRPFDLPFTMRTTTRFFSLNNVEFLCGIDEIRTPSGGGLSKLSTKVGNPFKISPDDKPLVSCGLQGMSPYVSARITPWTTYWLLGVQWCHQFAPRTWRSDATPPRWIEGLSEGTTATDICDAWRSDRWANFAPPVYFQFD